jgi:ribosomal protein S18 acetylase RimI-like enzyme
VRAAGPSTAFLPVDWHQHAGMRAAVADRRTVARLAGLRFLVERIELRWPAEPGMALLPRPGRLAFRPVSDDAELLAVVRGTLQGTLDAHARRDVARDGVDAAAHALVEELPGPRSLVRLAYNPAGRCVGITVPGLRPWGADISYVGVLPEHRGNGYADELLLEASHLLVDGGGTEIVAATDVSNTPMAAAFARCGYMVVDRLMVHV